MSYMSSKIVNYKIFVSTNMGKTNTMKVLCKSAKIFNIPNQEPERGRLLWERTPFPYLCFTNFQNDAKSLVAVYVIIS